MKKIKDLLEKKNFEVATVPADKTVFEAAKMMADMKIGSVLVTVDNNVKGIFTERDVLNKIVAQGTDPGKVKLEDVMSKDLLTCSPDDTIEEVSRLISGARKRHIPVIEKGKLMGIVTSGDIIASVLQDRTIEVEHMKNYIQGNITT